MGSHEDLKMETKLPLKDLLLFHPSITNSESVRLERTHSMCRATLHEIRGHQERSQFGSDITPLNFNTTINPATSLRLDTS